MKDFPVTLDFSAVNGLDDREFFAFCQGNPNLHIERNADGTITLMSPAGFLSSFYNGIICMVLGAWAQEHGLGMVTDSSGGYLLPDGAVFAPDAAWISDERLRGLTPADMERFLPACPDFVIELASPSDHLPHLRRKMQLWLANGVRLAWLIDPATETVEIYSPESSPTVLQGFDQQLSGEAVLPGMKLDLAQLRRP